MTTHLDHIVSVKPKRSGGFTIRIKMPNGAGRITADAAVTTPEQAERVAVRIIDILARKKQESTHECLSDATADLLAEQRRARLEQCSITVVDTSSDGWNVCLDSISQESFDTEDDAWTYAYELASDMLDDGDWE